MAQLHISLLGTPQLQLDAVPIELERRKALALFVYLLVTKAVYSREALATFLFPDVDISRGLAYLRNTLWTINKTLGDTWLSVERDTVQIVPQAGLWVDVWAFAQYEGQADNLQALQSAVALYRDDFLRGFSLPDSDLFDEWQFFQVQSFRQRLCDVLEKLTRGYIGQNRYEEGIPYARRWVLMDNLNESAHRNLMRLYDWTGQRSAALRQYQTCADLLRDQLGIAPDAKTRSLFHDIQARHTTKQTMEVMALNLTTSKGMIFKTTQDNLPTPATPFISRERDIAEILRLLKDDTCRLLTLIGQGGIGKTRLSIHMGEMLRGEFADGVYFVPLTPVTSAESFWRAIAETLRFDCIDGNLRADIHDYLRQKEILLILDNFEQLLDHAELVSDILHASLGTKILITSRERLNLRQEWIYEVDGLAYPSVDTSFGDIEKYGAVALFVQSAKQTQPDFALSQANAPHIIDICQLVEGMPLGIELAASWLQMLSVEEIAHEIQKSYDFLSSSFRNLPPRHRSMRAVFESSWERLTAQEAHTICRLAVFRGGFDRPAARAVADAELPILLALVNKSLIRRVQDGRYDMHELLRQFAEEKLIADPPAYHITRTRHSEYYAQYLESLNIALKGGNQVQTLNAIERDSGNIYLAWSWACRQGYIHALNHLLHTLLLYVLIRSRIHEVRELSEEALKYIPSDNPDTRLFHQKMQVLSALLNFDSNPYNVVPEQLNALMDYFRQLPDSPDLGVIFVLLQNLSHYLLGDTVADEYWIKRAQAIFDATGDTFGKIMALRGLGWVVHERIQYADSKRIFQQAYDLSRLHHDIWNEGENIRSLAEVAYTLGEYPLAEQMIYEGIFLSEQIGDRVGIASGLGFLGTVLFRLGKYDDCQMINTRCIELLHDLGNTNGVAWQLLISAELHRVHGRVEQANAVFAQTLNKHDRMNNKRGMAWTLIGWAWHQCLLGNLDEAQALIVRASDCFEKDAHRLWGMVMIDNIRAEIACSRGDFITARQLIDTAIDAAEKCQSIMFQTRNWVTLARIFADNGDKHTALIWLEKAIAHHATWADIRDRALQLQNEWLLVLARA
jgi:predicted ATPase/DNA-binding SARP family transcriptional activator